MSFAYLVDDAAIDASRMTGIPWSWERAESRGTPRPFISFAPLSYLERWRLALAVIGGNAYVDIMAGIDRTVDANRANAYG